MFVAIDQVFTLENILYLAKGALLSVAIAALSLLIGLVLGILGASGRRSKHKVPRAIAFVYVTIIKLNCYVQESMELIKDNGKLVKHWDYQVGRQ